MISNLLEYDDDKVEIELHTAPTPNGWKISIALEEMSLPYAIRTLSFSNQDQKHADFLRINPNGRIPAIVDRKMNRLSVFESGAILVYLAERSGRFLPKHVQHRKEAMEWLMFQMSAVGPNFGQAFTFKNYPTPVPEAEKRFSGEARRLCGVLDGKLSKTRFIAGSYTIADMALFPWVKMAPIVGVDFDEYANLARWITEVGARPAVALGLTIPPKIHR